MKTPQFFFVPYQIKNIFQMFIIRSHESTQEGEKTDVAFMAYMDTFFVIINGRVTVCFVFRRMRESS